MRASFSTWLAGLAMAATACGGSVAPVGGHGAGGDGAQSSSGGGSAAAGSSGGATASTSSGAGSSSGGSSSGESSSSGGSSSGGSGGPAGGAFGSIELDQCVGPINDCYVGFDFSAVFGVGATPSGCAVTAQEGSCAYYDCTGAPTTQTSLNAGTLTISGGTLQAVPVGYEQQDYFYQSTGVAFSPGQTLTVSATGGDVPAFGPLSIVAPAQIALTSLADGATISIESDLQLTWTGGQSGATMLVQGGGKTGADTFLSCSWDAAAGAGTIPAAILAPLAGQTSGLLLFGQRTTTSIEAGGYSITEGVMPYSGVTVGFQ